MVEEILDHSSTASETPPGWIKRSARTVERIVFHISRTMNIIGIIVLVVLTVLTVSDVLGRALFRSPVLGTTELTEFMLATIVFLCIAWCAMKEKMIRVDLFVSRLSVKTRAILDSITQTIGLGLLVIMAWQTFLESLAIQNSTKVSSILAIPVYPFAWITTAGMIVLCLVAACKLVENIAKAVK
jgi:TRAP-type C4-dicarboxylate transport system permease small subunit